MGTGIMFLCAAFTCFQSLAENQPLNSETVNKQRIARAEDLFSQLKGWQDNKDWEDFFSNKDVYLSKITELLYRITSPEAAVLKSKYMIFEVKRFFNDSKGKRKAFNDFIREVKNIKKPSSETVSFLRKTVLDLKNKSEKNLYRRVSSLYVSLIKKSKSKDVLKKEAERFYLNGDMDNFSSIAEAYLSLINGRPEFLQEIKRLIEKSSCGGVKDKCAPYFAEGLFNKYKDETGKLLNEGLTYLRGYNLEKSSEYNKARDSYEDFLNRFPESKLSDEVLFRLGCIYMYKLRDFPRAKGLFKKLKNKGYDTGWELDVLEKGAGKEGLSYNEKEFFSALFGEDKAARGNFVQAESFPSRIFIGEKAKVRAVSLSPDTGCLTPEGLFLWSGDLGGVKVTTNTPEVAVSFDSPGIKDINLVEEISNGILGYDSVLVNVYKLDSEVLIDNLKDSKTEFKVRITPYIPEEFLSFNWEVKDKEGHKVYTSSFPEFRYQLNPGEYTVSLNIFFLNRDIFKRNFSFSIK